MNIKCHLLPSACRLRSAASRRFAWYAGHSSSFVWCDEPHRLGNHVGRSLRADNVVAIPTRRRPRDKFAQVQREFPFDRIPHQIDVFRLSLNTDRGHTPSYCSERTRSTTREEFQQCAADRGSGVDR
jgi:hypothetical protein